MQCIYQPSKGEAIDRTSERFIYLIFLCLSFVRSSTETGLPFVPSSLLSFPHFSFNAIDVSECADSPFSSFSFFLHSDLYMYVTFGWFICDKDIYKSQHTMSFYWNLYITRVCYASALFFPSRYLYLGLHFRYLFPGCRFYSTQMHASKYMQRKHL